MRRIVAVLVAAAFQLTMLAPATPAAAYTPPPVSPFTDVATTHVFYEPMAWMKSRGISTGYQNTNGTTRYEPSAPVLREQVAAFLYRLEGSPVVPDLPVTSPFTDVPTSHAFFREIVWLSRSGITTGYADGTFRPSQPVLREQVAAFLYRLEGSPPVSNLPLVLSPFADVLTSHEFYVPIVWLSRSGITTGYAEGAGRPTFRPSQPVLREQIAAFLFRLEDADAPVPPVTGLSASPTDTQIRLTWDRASGTDLQRIVVRRLVGATPPGSPTAGALIAELGPTATSVTDTGRLPATTYSYAVFVVGSGGEYSAAATVSGTTQSQPPMAFDSAPAPTVAGTAKVGSTLTAEPGAWVPAAAFTYQWWAAGSPIAGATGRTLVVPPELLGTQVSVRVTGSSGGRVPTTRESGRTAAVAAGSFATAPVPVVEGAARVGAPLTVRPGAWAPAATMTYQWFVGGDAVQGATSTTFVPAVGHLGRAVTVQVTGSATGYATTTRSSAATAAVANGTFVTAKPVVNGVGRVGQTLTATVPAWSPAATSTSWTWLRNGTPIAGATGSSYRLASADSGVAITARATGTRAGYDTASVTSDPVQVGVVPASVSVAGTITASTVWGPDQAKVYRVTGDLAVPAGVTLTLLPGTVVKFDAGVALRVQGTVQADGTAASNVVLTSVRDDTIGGDTNGDGQASSAVAGDYVGVAATGQGAIRWTRTKVAYASTAIEAVADSRGTPTVALADTAVSRSSRCVAVTGPVVGSFTGSVRDCGVGVSSSHAFDARGVDWGSPSGPFPYGTGSAAHGESVVVAPWVGMDPPPRPALAARQAPVQRTTCPDVMFVGVRGSGEAPTSIDPTTPGTFDADESGFGAYNYVIASKLAEEVNRVRPATIGYLGVHYLAVQIPSYDPEVNYTMFLGSVFDGVDKLDQLLVSEAARCPSTGFVLLGNSQGAMVLHVWMAEASVAVQPRVAGVVILANPARVVRSTETLWQGPGVVATAGVSDVSGGWTGFYPGFDVPVPEWAVSRTISMCHQNDVFCAFRPGADLYPHLDYSVEELQSLAIWQGPRVAARLPTP
ncbi:MAG: S-layer homology domain-containing protein [Aeromicrobium sp.]|uniref:S-layer homology domain-containing protein n=1 Tax=Aeromicrobium sp. TaxID=1871063 RepID=UPI00261E4420|nr:S-layer homology domain-containing protein [Aeromicrobium sp.]MDF1706225.1 S-layer homology domain-containing protein [Aeromicrobium sp.]